ncbi:M14 family metallopeptidase [Pendulispora albinea]|uniref:M14 family metallopeptidase n=1 Tax=Pendulispora albinea TaxID=2741071 RepID=A0ABZ2M646_9BACT
MTQASNEASLRTLAEQTDFKKTGRYDEVLRLAKAYERTWPEAVRSFEYGHTPEGRPLVALVASRTGALTSEEVAKRKIPVLLLQGGIHPGESDGKDAGFMALRDMLEARHPALERIAIVFVPVANVDGHERFGRWSRPNQVGPEEMGRRTTAQNLNMNRDYTKADAPEMQALLRLLTAWDPIVYADLHVTNGADFEHDVSVQVEPIYVGDPGLHPTGTALRDHVMQKLAASGSLPLPFYPSLLRRDDPASGFQVDAYLPRFSTGYFALRNRLTLLLETHSWKDYPTRVRITLNTISALVEWTDAEGARALALAQEIDAKAAKLGGTAVPVEYETGEHVTTVAFRGYAYTRTPSAVSGILATRYDPTKPEIWHVPLKDTVQTKRTEIAPRGGYVVSAAFAELVGERLALHGIAFRRLTAGIARAPVETFRASQVTFTPKPFEGRTMVSLDGQWRSEPRDIAVGSLFVPIEQAGARLIMALLEPAAPDSFASWGFFNAMYERKEYMDAYVTERVAEEMLARDPELRAEFARKLDDPSFARNPEARLDFFYRRHPSFDDHFELYPVFRANTVL